MEQTPQAREPDPADYADTAENERVMQRLLDEVGNRQGEKAQAQLKAELETGSYDPTKLTNLAEVYFSDPDEEEQTRRHRMDRK